MIKKISITIILVIALFFSFSNLAYADVSAGAGLLASALSALNVDLLVGGGATAATLAPWLNGNYSIIGSLTGVADGYIKVGDSSVIIDGVEYETIFLDPQMAIELHTQAFDFITQKAITSNSSGILAQGVGYFGTVPMFAQPGSTTADSQSYSFGIGGGLIGDVTVDTPEVTGTPITYNVYMTYNNSRQRLGINPFAESYFPVVGHFTANTNTRRVYFTDGNYSSGSWSSAYTANPFSYSYVAGVIDATPLPSDYGFQAFVPVETLEDAGFSPGTYVIDGGTGTADVSALIQLLDEIFALQQIAEPEFVEAIDPPVPPTPIPTDALGEVPYPDFLDTFGQSIYDRLDNIGDGIDTVGQSITDKLDDVDETIDTVGQSIVDELEAQTDIFDTIGTAIDNIESAVTDVVDGIQVKVGEIADTLVDIKDGILEAIEEGPIKLIDSGLDVLRSVFGSILQTIRSHVGIWHYVVSWVQSISTPFNWILGIASGTSYYMVLPLYALVAGTLVIAIYKRFGR